MNFQAIATVIGVVSGIVGIIGYFLPIPTSKARSIYAAYIFVVALAVGFITYESTRLARLNSISERAHRLYQVIGGPGTRPEDDVSALMTFLEQNQDIFPDAYRRANEDYASVMKNQHRYQDVTDLRGRLEAIVNGESNLTK